MNRRPILTFALLGLGFLAILLACNLTGSPEPPTLVPRASATPPPTIGYATLAPNEYPQAATQIAPNAPRTDASLLNLLNQVEPDRLFQHIDALAAMKTRHANSTSTTNEGIGAAETYVLNQFYRIRDQAFQSSFSVATDDFPIDWAKVHSTGTNIIGVLQGTEIGGGVIVLSAHYDSINYNFDDPNGYAPGANDDASGMAALIEIARIMSQRRHRATVMFIAFSAEEIQRKGSIAFVNDYIKAKNISVTAMLDMDIIGSSTGPDGSIDDRRLRIFSADPNESRSRQLARSLNLIASRLAPDMEVVVQNSVDREGRYSDHMSFSDAGYPAVRFVEANEELAREHTERDTIDDVQATYLVHATQTILACMTALADGPRAPQNVSLRDNGSGLRTLVWDIVPGATSYVVALRRPDALIYDPYFETTDNSVTWEGFVPDRFAGLAIASKDANGLIGPFSFEYGITG
jgi:Peptidase family M28